MSGFRDTLRDITSLLFMLNSRINVNFVDLKLVPDKINIVPATCKMYLLADFNLVPDRSALNKFGWQIELG
jgi:hypothetical protein